MSAALHHPTKVCHLLAIVMEELSILLCIGVLKPDKLQDEWPPCDNACSSREEVLAYDCLQH